LYIQNKTCYHLLYNCNLQVQFVIIKSPLPLHSPGCFSTGDPAFPRISAKGVPFFFALPFTFFFARRIGPVGRAGKNDVPEYLAVDGEAVDNSAVEEEVVDGGAAEVQ
jgi:hypothetical protein